MNMEVLKFEDVPTRPKVTSADILTQFLQSGATTAVVDVEKLQRNKSSVYTGLKSYVRRHDMSVKVYMQGGEIILQREDVNDKQ